MGMEKCRMEKDETRWESPLKMLVNEMISIDSDTEDEAVTQLVEPQRDTRSEPEDLSEEEGDEEEDGLSMWEDYFSTEDSDDVDQACKVISLMPTAFTLTVMQRPEVVPFKRR